MKKKYTFSILAFLTAITLLMFSACKDDDDNNDTPSQPEDWERVEIDSLGVALKDIAFDNDGNGWIVGDKGTFITTEDNGETWIVQENLTNKNLNDIFWLNNTKMWIVGNHGVILFSGNNGESWDTQTSPTEGDLKSVYFPNSSDGWIVGTIDNETPAIILNTGNGGQGTSGWVFQDPPESDTPPLNDVYFVDKHNGYICGDYGTVLQTDDAGLNWEKGNLVSSNHLYSITFVTDQTGFAVGEEGVFINTANAGEQWWLANQLSYFNMYTIVFIDEYSGWTAGENSRILRTINGAAVWEEEFTGSVVTLYSMYMDVNKNGWTVGVDRNDEPALLKYISEEN